MPSNESLLPHESATLTGNPTPILKTTYSLLAAYSKLSPAALLAHLSPTFTHHVLPTAMGMPSRDRAAFEKHSAMITGIFSKFAMVPLSVVADEVRRSVVVHARMEGVLKAGEEVPYENECVLMLRFEEEEGEDGVKICEMKEFVDSAKAMEMKAQMAKKMGAEGVQRMMHE